MRFVGKVVLVTGAGSGIGRAICEAFAAEGAHVAAVDVNADGATITAAAVREQGRRALALEVDVADPESVRHAVQEVVAGLGPVDVLVNSAGVRDVASFLDLPFTEWQRVIAVNLTGTFVCSQAVAQHLARAGRGGKIVNLTSVAGLMAVPNRTAYVSSKHAVIGLTKAMAMELADRNIQVNAIAPGVVRTALTEGYFHDPEVLAGIKRLHPAGRCGEPAEIAALVLFLASAQADFITGATIPIDGGFAAGKRP